MRKCISLAYISTDLTNHALNSCGFGRKTQLLGNFFLRKLQKCIIVAYFSNNLAHRALIFRSFGRKSQIVWKFWEKIWKLLMKMLLENRIFIFLLMLENLLLKIGPSEITQFYKINSVSGGVFPLPSLASPLLTGDLPLIKCN